MNYQIGQAQKKRIEKIEIDGKISDNKKDIANAFNKFFSKIPKQYHDKLPKMKGNIRIRNSLKYLKNKKSLNFIFVSPTTFEKVQKIIRKMKKKSSTGLDGMSPKLLQYLTDNIIYCYVHIFNLSLSQGNSYPHSNTVYK